MILGIGCDIVNVARFKALDSKVLEKIFTKEEIEEISDGKDENVQCIRLASRFSLKEAVSKAVHISLFELGGQNIIIIKDEDGAPRVEMRLQAKQKVLEKHNIKDFKLHVSLSHEEDFSLAFAVMEKS